MQRSGMSYIIRGAVIAHNWKGQYSYLFEQGRNVIDAMAFTSTKVLTHSLPYAFNGYGMLKSVGILHLVKHGVCTVVEAAGAHLGKPGVGQFLHQ